LNDAIEAAVPAANEIHQGGKARRVHRWPLVLVVLFVAFAVVAQVGRRVVVANPTESVEPGLYLAWRDEVAVGRLVSFPMPEGARPYFADRAGRPVEEAERWFLIKPVIAGPGDTVDTTGDRVLVNGVDAGPIYTHDSAGRALPQWRHRRVLADGEWFVVSLRCPGSLDGRYFGPIRQQDVEHVRRPLVRWGDEGDASRWFGAYVDRPNSHDGRSSGGQ
jgi:conjugative transfer signal peptidase TraF